ncbi:YsnF/AvaK domain-containing protein [Paracoccus everestensis]|uniref:YsnF/AvaK domain-containing protein n=1 Tax=Paracoccus everestensis TaxID=2903900 RepID=UPI001F273F57|nr:YsnF/AvaK domain-containing protein [Paracoccus everestensis]
MTYDNDFGTTGGRMDTVGGTSLSAMFDSHDDAQRAVDRLVQAGIPMAQVRMVSGGSASTTTTSTTRTDDDKGFWDSLSDFFFPDEDRYAYAEGLSRGGYLVTVTGLGSAQYDQALDILDDEGSVDLDERTESWRSEGWGGYETSDYATSATGGSLAGGAMGGSMAGGSLTGTRTGDLDRQTEYGAQGSQMGIRSDDETIPVIEERIRIGKRDTSHGRVRVRAYTVEEPVNESVDLREERVEIERRPVDRAVSGADVAFQERTLEAEEYREEAVVQKEARVVEEIGLRKTSDTHTETVSDTVRRTEVEIEDDRDGSGTIRRDTDRDDRIV